ncbi:MAG: hypothetical protein WCK42_07325, partial [Myxococcaceae bacterium]
QGVDQSAEKLLLKLEELEGLGSSPELKQVKNLIKEDDSESLTVEQLKVIREKMQMIRKEAEKQRRTGRIAYEETLKRYPGVPKPEPRVHSVTRTERVTQESRDVHQFAFPLIVPGPVLPRIHPKAEAEIKDHQEESNLRNRIESLDSTSGKYLFNYPGLKEIYFSQYRVYFRVNKTGEIEVLAFGHKDTQALDIARASSRMNILLPKN